MNVGMKKKNPAIKSLISVGGWNFNDCNCSPSACFGQGSATCPIFSEIAASADKIRMFAANIIDFCRRWGFDGFDLDWEYPVKAGHNSNEKVNGEFQAESDASDIPAMSKYLDMINLMTYDIHVGWEDRTGHNAPLYATAEDAELAGYPLSVSWAVDYWLQGGASPSQVTLGLGTYGRGWTLKDRSQTGFNAPASGKAAPGVSTQEAGYMSYYEVEDKIAKGATVVYDTKREGPYIVADGEWTGYDNQQSFCSKLAFAKSRNLMGSMIWALDLDDFAGAYGKGDYPLVTLAGSGGAGCSGLPTPAPTPPTPPPPTPPTPTPTPTPTPPPPTPPTPPSESCCKWSSNCGGSCASGWCSSSQSSCSSCGGTWCE